MKPTYNSYDELERNWRSDFLKKKHEGLHFERLTEFLMYKRLIKALPSRNRRSDARSFRIQDVMYSTKIIAKKSFFNGPTGVWNGFDIEQIISNEVIKFRAQARPYTRYVFVLGKGIFREGTEEYEKY